MNFWKDLRAQRQAAFDNADPAKMRQKLLKKQSGLCYWCDRQMGPGDRSHEHILPHYLGGPFVIGNLALAHQSCNESRGSHFSDHLLERLPDSVLRLAIGNLQALPAETYEGDSYTDERLVRVLEARKEMETKLWSLWTRRMAERQESLMKDQEPALERRLEIERRKQFNRSEKDFQKMTTELWKSKIGRLIRRYEKKEKLAEKPIKQLVVVRRPRKEKHVE